MLRPDVLPFPSPRLRLFTARIGRLRQRALPAFGLNPPPGCPAADPGGPRIEILTRSPSPDAAERGRIRTQGRFLARQENWETLALTLRAADTRREASPGGTPRARLLAEGAHSDALDCALAAVDRSDPTAARASLFALQEALEEMAGDPWCAMMLAQAHLAVARAWSGKPGAPDPTPLRRDARLQHLETAARLIEPFDPLELGSPTLAALRCALLEIRNRPSARVADDYEDLIDLDPACPDHMRALGRDLAPDRFGSWEQLERGARHAAGLVSDLWGAGGYAWVWFDVLATLPEAFEHVDAELFVEALHDILARHPGQHMTNLLAAYCGLTLSGAAPRGTARARIAGCFGWIVQNHLREIHADLWARARPMPGTLDPGEVLRRGQSRALSALAEHYAPQLRLGRQVIFHPDRVELQPAGCASCTLAPCGALAYPPLNLRDEDPPCLT